MKELIKNIFPKTSDARWVLAGFYAKPFGFIVVLVKSLYATHKLTRSFLPIRVRVGAGQKVDIKTSKNTKVVLEGNLNFCNWQGEISKSSILLSEGASFKVLGDLTIGPGVHIIVSKNAELEFGGQKYSSGSGITCNTRIMVSKEVKIGTDTIMAWGVYISDSDWHEISWGDRVKPVKIGDHVWIAHDVSILKGANIPNGCVVGAKSLVSSGNYDEKTILAGIPAIVRRMDVEWTR